MSQQYFADDNRIHMPMYLHDPAPVIGHSDTITAQAFSDLVRSMEEDIADQHAEHVQSGSNNTDAWQYRDYPESSCSTPALEVSSSRHLSYPSTIDSRHSQSSFNSSIVDTMMTDGPIAKAHQKLTHNEGVGASLNPPFMAMGLGSERDPSKRYGRQQANGLLPPVVHLDANLSSPSHIDDGVDTRGSGPGDDAIGANTTNDETAAPPQWMIDWVFKWVAHQFKSGVES
jgi:hypothetical protein